MDPSPPPSTRPLSPGPAAGPHADPDAETRRLLAAAKAAFAAEQAAADAEEAAEGPSLFERGRRLADEVRDDPVQAVADRLDDRLGDHKKAVALGILAGGTVLLLQSRWVRKRALPIVASAATAFVQDRVRDWITGDNPDDAPPASPGPSGFAADANAAPAQDAPSANPPAAEPAEPSAKPTVDDRPLTAAEELDERLS